MQNYDQLIGMTFGRLTITKILPRVPYKNRRCLAECDCGTIIDRAISSIRGGSQLSCGNHRKGIHLKHGLSKSRIYKTYTTMISRCYNPESEKYPLYGGRGIVVCEEWRRSPEAFYSWAIANGYEDHLTIDRVDTNGNYEPSNCRWATPKEQANNRRTSRFITYKGQTKTVTAWADQIGVDSRMIFLRLKRGWTIEKAIETPKRIW